MAERGAIRGVCPSNERVVVVSPPSSLPFSTRTPPQNKPPYSEELKAINEGNVALRILPEGVNLTVLRWVGRDP
jgi:hypothetical protein